MRADAVFAPFETDVRGERQAKRIARARKAGVDTGGKPRIARGRVRKLVSGGYGSAAVAKALVFRPIHLIPPKLDPLSKAASHQAAELSLLLAAVGRVYDGNGRQPALVAPKGSLQVGLRKTPTQPSAKALRTS